MASASSYVGWGPEGEVQWVQLADGCNLLTRRWVPQSTPAKGIVHICHGMAEHSARYGHFGAFLANHGFIVYSADHRAHGLTGERAKKDNASGLHWLGHVDVQCGALQQIVLDHECLVAQELHEHPNLRLVIFGHSMGSVIARLLAASKAPAAALAGLVLSGVPADVPSLQAAAFGPLLVALRAIYGGSGVAPLVSKLSFEKYNAQFAPNATDDDWLNRDAIEVRKYVDDPLCGFKCSVDFIRSFLVAQKSAGSVETLSRIPQRLPVLVVNGGCDPVTINDAGARSHQQVSDAFAAAKRQSPKIVVYSEARHEVLNELCREEVASDLLSFILRCIAAPQSKL
jgi:alpha-beta hydrolase superfamily lysophospholipase